MMMLPPAPPNDEEVVLTYISSLYQYMVNLVNYINALSVTINEAQKIYSQNNNATNRAGNSTDVATGNTTSDK